MATAAIELSTHHAEYHDDVESGERDGLFVVEERSTSKRDRPTVLLISMIMALFFFLVVMVSGQRRRQKVAVLLLDDDDDLYDNYASSSFFKRECAALSEWEHWLLPEIPNCKQFCETHPATVRTCSGYLTYDDDDDDYLPEDHHDDDWLYPDRNVTFPRIFGRIEEDCQHEDIYVFDDALGYDVICGGFQAPNVYFDEINDRWVWGDDDDSG